MSETRNLGLPLLAAAQAQKHVTMNEALLRLDVAAASVARSFALAPPNEPPEEGVAFIVAAPAAGEWVGRESNIAYFVNGGWDFIAPSVGLRFWVEELGALLVFVGGGWSPVSLGATAAGALTRGSLHSADQLVAPGGGFDTDIAIPDRAIVLGVTARVLADVTGSALTGWRLGVSGSSDRYGNGIGLSAGSSLTGVTSAPVGYYGETPLRIEPEGGTFSGGLIRLAIHCLELTPPALV